MLWKVLLIIFGVFSILSSIVSFCGYVEEKNPKDKDKFLLRLGILFIVLGVCCIAGAVYFL